MILIIGGAWQGKLDFARELAEKRGIMVKVSEGKTDSLKSAESSSIIHDFHEYIKRILKTDDSVEDFISTIERNNPDAIIISNELGCGIVPMDPEDRAWREETGRASVRIAKSSDEVYRLVCGIATRIK
jgi:adenosylcobinamide kinase/adenosylcobinamide-phosphate guanylyltransferase